MNFIHKHFSHRRESAFNWKLETGNLLHISKPFRTFAFTIQNACTMDTPNQQPIELHCRAILHLYPDQFTIRDIHRVMYTCHVAW